MGYLKTTFLGVATAATLFGGTQAMAADLYTPMPEPAPAFSWNGFYAGVNAGYAWGETKGTDVDGWTNVANDPWTATAEGDGFTGGGQVGYNFQMDQIVFGAEADISYLDVSGRSARDPDFGDNYVASGDGFLGTVRGRLGFSFDRMMIYGTGGLAFGDTGSKWVDDGGGTQFTLSSDTQVGWTAGGGLEYAMTDTMSLKAEYLYYDLGTENVSFNNAPGGFCANAPTCNFKLDNTGSIVRVGLNFHF